MQFAAVLIAGLAGMLVRTPPPLVRVAQRSRAGPVHAKITAAALAAAFASKENKTSSSSANLTLAQKEGAVIEAIRDGLDAGRNVQPKRVFSAMGDFGAASGNLAQTWLTPQQLERCCFFWWGGSTMLARDVRRGRLGFSDLRAAPWFALLALNTFPWTPLLVPLVGRAVNSSDGAAFLPAAFGERKIAALQRLTGDEGLAPAGEIARDFRTPQNIAEGVSFFSDGFKMLSRDLWRGRLLAYGDSPAAFARFGLLALSTFPLTPLLLPIIDKRRESGVQSDYVPAAFRQRRLHAFARHRTRAARSEA